MDYVNLFETTILPAILHFCGNLLVCLVIYLIGSRLIRFIRKLVRKSLEKAGVDKGICQFLDSFLKVALYIVMVLMVIGRFGFQATSVIAILGSAGVAVGLALQGSLSNLAGGVLLLVLKPFTVGDYIVEDGGKEGVVTQIHMFYTKLVTGDNREITIPNGTLANERIVNVSRREERRLDITVGISYFSDLKKAKELLEQLALADSAVLTDKGVQVMVQELGDSAVVLGCRVWVKNGDYWDVKFRLLEQIKETFDANQIGIPFPQVEVSGSLG
jgi:small conductance mechanosensitive channel